MARQQHRLDPHLVLRAHGAFNSVNGLWPLLHLRSFEAVFGRKTDHWLVRTVAGLLLTVGVAQLSAGTDAASIRLARRIGLGTSIVLGSIDVAYAPRGRISRLYLLDALAEATLVAAWLATKTPDAPRGSGRYRNSSPITAPSKGRNALSNLVGSRR